MSGRAQVAALALSAAVAWNISNVGAVAQPLADAYGTSLATIGLFTTSLFVVHLAMQLPAGRAVDRFGARGAGLVALLFLAAGNALALVAPDVPLALGARALAGVGTGIGFVSGSDYVRGIGGSAALQGVYGGAAMGGGGLALAVVPQLVGSLGWRSPYLTALVLALAVMPLLAVAPPAAAAQASARAAGVVRDRRLYRFAVVHAASFGMSVVAGNWIVTLLQRTGSSRSVAGVVGALTLTLGLLTRPLGGYLLRDRPASANLAVGASLVVGAAGAGLAATGASVAVVGAGAALMGLASGVPFAPMFTGAQKERPDAPGAAIGLVNALSALVIVAGTPLVGLTFSLPGDGRIGFVAIAVVWAAALLALPTPGPGRLVARS